MRFTLSSSVLNSKLSTLSKVIASKNSMQILDCFLFEISSGQLTITATDNSNMMKCNVELSESLVKVTATVHSAYTTILSRWQ